MTSLALMLEDFAVDREAAAADDERARKARAAGRDEGYADGVLDGEDNARAADREAVAALREALSDAALVQAAARADAYAALRPLVEALIASVAPQAARAGLPALAHQALEARFRGAPEPKAKVFAHPDAVDALSESLEGLATVEADPSLGTGQARATWRDGGAEIDADACAAAAAEAVAAFFEGRDAAVEVLGEAPAPAEHDANEDDAAPETAQDDTTDEAFDAGDAPGFEDGLRSEGDV